MCRENLLRMFFYIFNIHKQFSCFKKDVNKFENKNGYALKLDELTNYKLVDRKKLNFNFDTSFVKIG